MGGIGSGRRGARCLKLVSNYTALDVNELREAGVLANGWAGSWEAQRPGEPTSLIYIRGGVSRIELQYSLRFDAGGWRAITQRVPVKWLACRFGGQRPYFHCPGCLRRCEKLPFGPIGYGCRRCLDLCYESQREDTGNRARRRAAMIRLRLHGQPDVNDPFPRRPKGMWNRTYDGLIERHVDAEVVISDEFEAMARQYCARRNKRELQRRERQRNRLQLFRDRLEKPSASN